MCEANHRRRWARLFPEREEGSVDLPPSVKTKEMTNLLYQRRRKRKVVFFFRIKNDETF
jgi:hypothetical protein